MMSEGSVSARLLAYLAGAALIVSACSSSATPAPTQPPTQPTTPQATTVAPTEVASQPASQASPWFPGDVIGGSGKPIAKTCGPNGSYQIAYSQSNFAEPYRAAADAQMTKLFATVPQFHLTITDGTGDSNVQNTQLQDDITKGVDLVMTSPQASTPGTPAVTAIYNAGIPVILLDRGIDTDAYTAFIGGDNVAIGKMAGEYVGKNLLPNGGDVAIVEGDQTTQPALDRQNGFEAGVAEFPNIHVVAAQTANWRKADATTVTKDMLTAHPSIKFIYFANDEMESGGAIAIADAGLTGKVLTGGTDGLVSPAGDNGMEQVSSGQQAFTIIYPTNAPEAFAMVKDILLNCATSVPKTTHPAVTLVDKTNVARVTADLLAAAAGS